MRAACSGGVVVILVVLKIGSDVAVFIEEGLRLNIVIINRWETRDIVTSMTKQ